MRVKALVVAAMVIASVNAGWLDSIRDMSDKILDWFGHGGGSRSVAPMGFPVHGSSQMQASYDLMEEKNKEDNLQTEGMKGHSELDDETKAELERIKEKRTDLKAKHNECTSSSLLAASTAVEQWANRWEMQFGVAKCGIISFTGHLAPRLDNPLDIRLHGQLVSRVESYKYLGVLIDSKLDHSAWLKQKRSALEHTISALSPSAG
ncbi:hypothetical protein BASA60_010477 [Batrachochytrium salamandrivorans]|nr:hypothetical protein BASA60_010477 [Batrachochytrium salamandrivorans]